MVVSMYIKLYLYGLTLLAIFFLFIVFFFVYVFFLYVTKWKWNSRGEGGKL